MKIETFCSCANGTITLSVATLEDETPPRNLYYLDIRGTICVYGNISEALTDYHMHADHARLNPSFN